MRLACGYKLLSGEFGAGLLIAHFLLSLGYTRH